LTAIYYFIPHTEQHTNRSPKQNELKFKSDINSLDFVVNRFFYETV